MLNIKQSEYLPTDHQERAADPNANVYVSASAGTGKTKILTDRFINLLLAGSDPKNIFCVTFTTAAAEEMRQRIMSRLEDLSRLNDQELKAEFKHLNHSINSKLLHAAYLKVTEAQHSLKIQTLHSFCLKLLETYSIYADLSGEFEILSSFEHQQLIETSLNNIFNTIPELKKNIQFLCNHYTLPTIKELLADSISYNLEPSPALEAFMLIHEANQDFVFEDECKKFIIIANNACQGFRSFDSWDELSDFFLTKDFSPRKQLLTQKLQQQHPGLLEKLRDIQEGLLSILESRKNQDSALINFHLYSIAHELKNEYLKNKERIKRITYDDILYKANDLLLKEPFVLYKIDYQIDHILVDEAQDLSEIQWDIIKILADEFFAGESSRLINRTVFIVGDFKQSIYGFQGARPEIFLSIKEYFKQKVHDAGKVWREITQSLSYRSACNILEFVNRIFETKFSNFAHHTAFKQEAGNIVMWPIVGAKPTSKANGFSPPSEVAYNDSDSDQILANNIADNIAGWLSCGKLISGTDKAVTPKDILIIIRKRSKFAHSLYTKIKEKGISITDVTSRSLTDYLLFRDLISLIKFHLFPEDDFNLVALLKSPFFGISDDELQTLCRLSSKPPLYKNIQSEKLHQLSETLQCNKPFRAFSKILYNQEIIPLFEAEFGGVTLEMFSYFLDLLAEFESSHTGSYLALMHFLAEQRYSPSAHEDSIRMMTAHSSKGLQAPIVILADSASTDYRVHNKILEGAHKLPVYTSNQHCRSPHVQELMQKHIALSDEEDLRLLYVALTRAENELYLAGVDNRSIANSWYEIARAHYTDDLISQDQFSNISIENQLTDLSPLPFAHNINPRSVLLSDEDYENKATKYGEMIHEMLYYRALFSESEYLSYINSISQKQHHLLSSQDVKAAIMETNSVFSKFAFCFEKNSRVLSECVISDSTHNKTYRLDKLLINESEIEVIDFKTDRTVPQDLTQLKAEYLDQIQNYVTILQAIYPNHVIKAGIIWTKTAEYMAIIL